VTGRPLDRAREIFFAYEGSRFYMSRDGVDSEYQRFSVPRELEKQWLDELTVIQLDMLESPGNWRVVNFLKNHDDVRHLSRLVHTTPLGAFWERCAYLELLVLYIKRCSLTDAADETQRARQYVIDQGRILEHVAPDERSRQRACAVIDAAKDLRSCNG